MSTPTTKDVIAALLDMTDGQFAENIKMFTGLSIERCQEIYEIAIWCTQQRFDHGATRAAQIPASRSTPSETEQLVAALEEIATYDSGKEKGYVDEWVQAEAYDRCKEIARDALARVKMAPLLFEDGEPDGT